MSTPVYSNLFSCMYDQLGPVGSLGRGTHHSIFRTTQGRDNAGRPVERQMIHDFAVLWDEDHDTRVISVLERLHLSGLLWPVMFAGERKGMLTLLVCRIFLDSTYRQAVQRICDDIHGDSWNLEIGQFHRRRPDGMSINDPAGIVNDDREDVITYLQGIDVLWRLGLKSDEPPAIMLRLPVEA